LSQSGIFELFFETLASLSKAADLVQMFDSTVVRAHVSAAGVYKARARIEQGVGKLKRFKRIALRCEKTATNFLSFVHLAAGAGLLFLPLPPPSS
jgi:transposase